MIEIKDMHLTNRIPDNLLKDVNVKNLAEALSKPLQGVSVWSYKINYMQHLRDLPEEIIDHLLWENHIGPAEGLKLARTKEEKINLLESSIELHRAKGTPYAIEKSLEVVGLKGKVEEWFEYEGNPYHFWVELELGQKFNDLSLITEMIEEYKNKRSWFDGFVVIALEQGVVYWDDSYSYPVYHQETNDFCGEAEMMHNELGGRLYSSDSYSYPVCYEETGLTRFRNEDTKSGTIYSEENYSYPVCYEETGEMSTPDVKTKQFDGVLKMEFEAYSYPVHYPECGDFETGG